jgi:hypothetical protein
MLVEAAKTRWTKILERELFQGEQNIILISKVFIYKNLLPIRCSDQRSNVAQRTSARGRKISKDFTSPARELKKKKGTLRRLPVSCMEHLLNSEAVWKNRGISAKTSKRQSKTLIVFRIDMATLLLKILNTDLVSKNKRIVK